MQLATRVADTTLIIQEGLGRKVADAINFSTMGLTGIIVAMIYGWELALVLLAVAPLVAGSGYWMIKAITAATQVGVDAYGEAGGIAQEALSNIRTVHVFNAMTSFALKYKAALAKTEAAGLKKGVAVGVGTGGMFFVIFCTYAIGMYYGAVKVADDQITGGRVLIIFFCIIMSSMALGQASPATQAIFAARAAAHGVYELIERESKIDATAASGKMLSSVRGEITLNNVSFAYPSRPDVRVCAGYSLTIPAGQKIALVGASGSGKSTIVSLLERFYDPLSGTVLLDDHDVKDLNLKWLRSQIGLVGQEPCLFQDSIANNIRHGKPDATLDEVIAAAKQANAYDFIMGFPDGLHTEVGDRGAQLSGGQKQRIAIARAIIKNPSILILDEATSALDTESEHIVQESLDRLVASGNRTTIIIAHRLSTIRNADRIVVLQAGRIAEDGTHDELVERPDGLYKALVDAQMKTSETTDDMFPVASGHNRLQHKPALTTEADAMASSIESASDTDASLPSGPVSIMRVWRLSQPEFLNLALGSLGALVNGAVFPIWGVLLTKSTVLFFRVDLGADTMLREASIWSGAYAALGANHQFAIACERLTSRIRAMCFDAMLRQDIGWFDDEKHSSGALTTRLATDSAAIRSMTAETLNAILVTLASVAVTIVIAFTQSWQMTLVILATFPTFMANGYIQSTKMSGGTGKDVNDGDTKAGALLSEAINSIRTVASFGLETTTNAKYLAYLQQSSVTDRKVGLHAGVAYGISQALMLLVLAFLFWFGGWLMLRGDLTFERMFMVLNPMFQCSTAVGMAIQSLGDVGKAKKAVQSIFGIIDRVPTINCAANDGLVLGDVKGELELHHVAFAYPSRPDAIIYKDYSLTVRAGQTLALVGGSGSGKSTAISLLERFYDPVSGAVFLDGHDLRSINVQSLRSHISIVSQEPVLFAGSIADNIATGKPGATKAEIEDAAKKASAHDFIMRFPNGYDTAVGDRGVQVSGGQKQRIAIARAIIRDPAVLLLDEATSALDTESERIVQASLDALLRQKRRTTVIVAHRLSTIRNADMIAVVHDGKVCELGTHDELVGLRDGMYAALVARQMTH
ncbi:hypothetical protein SPRG_09182 [Saprolegnia parasitica CBS 223.65]|uniref:Uncharacterized protein n=1 Tax=Saprolegnia parasitica (strain CBS 223.65) TaxID=695850 RepID=A0A067CEW1_SAPPC|nr:hypothetical protein SPRG_09182 [Saprolegnia parasitica CBS 223.65]KDO25357.1 hypothetical protein SPRG_09182 [Saprolegnia parasitica CBS 223.65]|eukprot:XP_012204006.1 hypothetical protein SPRG_09182 [Saprolegnia parasitica CBS 223.65]